MKPHTLFLTLALLLVSASACKKDFLDKQPLDQFAEEAVWSDPALIQTFVNNIYFGVPHGFSNMMLASLSDESMYNADFGSSNVTKCLVTPSDYSVWDFWSGRRYNGMIWNNVYKYIRATNLFLERIEKAPFTDKTAKDQLTGEVHFLRAFLYHNLVSVYGGVPVITKAYGLSDDFQVPRNSYEDCVKFISEECDKAAALLPLVQSGDNKGRASKGGALALKARLLLYAASDLYHNQSKWATGYANPELVGYVGANRTARWQAAKDAAKAVMELGIYSLYKANPGPTDSTAVNYGELFLAKETSEDIHIRSFISKVYDQDSWDGYNPGLYNNPNGYHGWGSNTPLGQLVDSYEMRDGSKFDWSNAKHAAEPYKNRDPRFYATILYEGVQWRKRPSDVVASDPKGVIQTGFWEKWNGTSMDVIPGLDTRKSPIEDWNGTYTGYYLRKFIDPSIDAQYVKQDVPWRFFRYTEVLMNYAEACLGLGQEAEAKTVLNQIRKRVGMPALTESGAALLERYRNERKIELAYEDHRFFDVRRWMLAPLSFANAKGVDIRYKLNADKTTASRPTFKVIDVQDRAWKDRAYFLPIKLDEMNRNSKLVQNPLY